MTQCAHSDDLHYRSATDMLADLRARRVSAVELLDAHVGRNEAIHAKVNAVVASDLERAREAARAIDEARARGRDVGPLAGIPMTVKDGFDVRGLPAVSGNPAYVGRDANCRDADVVAAARSAGAIIWGKTNVPFLCGDFQTYNAVYGRTNNPYDLTRTPSGSSGGSAAALSAGATPLEIGSDLGGSLRHPANACGVYALKTTWGRLSQVGFVPPLPDDHVTLDLAVVGPMARTPADLRLLHGVLSGRSQAKPAGVRGRRVALWHNEVGLNVGHDASDAVERAAVALGAQGADVRPAKPDIGGAALFATYRALLLSLMGLASSDDADVLAAQETRTLMKRRLASFFDDGWDAILMPIAPVPAFRHLEDGGMADRVLECDGQTIRYSNLLDWMGLATALHAPALAAPAGKTATGLPIGVQIVGRWDGEDAIIDYGDALDETFGFTPPKL